MNAWPHCTVVLPKVTPKRLAYEAVRADEEDPVVAPDEDAMGPNDEPTNDTYGNDTNSATFPIFPRFPQELRLKIWRSTFELRKITIRVESDGWISPSSVPSRPVALYVSSESREETLKWYRLLFGKSRYPTYFNPLIDIPHIRHGSIGSRGVKFDSPSPWFNFSNAFLTNLRNVFDANFLSSLRHLAIDRDLWVLRMGSAPRVMGMFKRLEQLYIVIDDKFLRDEDEWVDTDDLEEDRRDVIRFMSALSNDQKPPPGYHYAEERLQYILRRLKLRTSEWDHGRFKEPNESSGYAEYVNDDVLTSLSKGTESDSLDKEPKVKVVVEFSD